MSKDLGLVLGFNSSMGKLCQIGIWVSVILNRCVCVSGWYIGSVILNPLGPAPFSHSEMLHAASVLSDYCSAALARARHLMVGVRGWAAG